MELTLPSSKYKDTFLQAVKEYQASESSNRIEDLKQMDINYLNDNFEIYIDTKLSQRYGKNLPEGYVPQTEYWLIDSEEFIGRISIRHSLTPYLLKIGGHIGYDIRPSKRNLGYGTQILKLALIKCKDLDLKRVLVTCDDTNLGSKKIIEFNGGILENKVKDDNDQTFTLRYWIEIE